MEMGFSHPLRACVFAAPTQPLPSHGEGLHHGWLPPISQGKGWDYSSEAPKHLTSSRKSQQRQVGAVGVPEAVCGSCVVPSAPSLWGNSHLPLLFPWGGFCCWLVTGAEESGSVLSPEGKMPKTLWVQKSSIISLSNFLQCMFAMLGTRQTWLQLGALGKDEAIAHAITLT